MQLSGPTSGKFFAGNDYEWRFTVTRDGEPVSLSGMSFHFVMARTPVSEAVLTTEGGSPTATATVISANDGTFSISVANADSVDLLGTYHWQCQVEDGAGHKSNVHHGFFTFKPNMVPA